LKLEVFAYCSCGEELGEKTKFCAKCGRNVMEIIKKTGEADKKMKETFTCSCGEIFSSKSKFCLSCGSKVQKPSEIKCSCGETITPGKKFCALCGSPVADKKEEDIISVFKPQKEKKGSITCYVCNSDLPYDSLFCPDCGTKLENKNKAKMREKACHKCNSKLPYDALFCPDCGIKF